MAPHKPRRFRSATTAALGCLLLLGCGDAGAPENQVAANRPAAARNIAAEPAQRTIERLEREWAAAHVRQDVGWYDRHVAPEYRTILGNGQIASRADVIAHLRSSPPGQQLNVEQVDVRVHGDAAVATVTQSYSTASGKAGKSRLTDVWVKSGDGRWMVVHSHEGSIR